MVPSKQAMLREAPSDLGGYQAALASQSRGTSVTEARLPPSGAAWDSQMTLGPIPEDRPVAPLT